MKSAGPRFSVVDMQTGEVIDELETRPAPRRAFAQMYGSEWSAIHCPAANRLAKDRELTGESLRVLMYLWSQIETGNRIRLRQVDVARALGMTSAGVSRAIKKLVDKQILLPMEPFGWRLDPNYGYCGNPAGMVGRGRDGRLVFTRAAGTL